MSSSFQPQMPTNLSGLYKAEVQAGKLRTDPAQAELVDALQRIQTALQAARHHGWLKSFFSKPGETPRGLFIWGAVGRGKSLLMDMFYHTVDIGEKRRVHFHAFMQEVHAIAHGWRREIEQKRLKIELLDAVARDIAQDARLLCLDELQVTDVADAMILSKLFSALFDQGVVVVTTSNRPPEALYQGGLQRETFLNFIALVRQRMQVMELRSPEDYRLQQMKALQATYLFPLTPETADSLDRMLAQLTHNAPLEPLTLEVQGRKLQVPQSYGGIACFSFADLCERALGAADYLTLAKHFHTVFLRNIPLLTPEKRNEARRFITLIDTFYDHHVKLICTATAEPARLYMQGDGAFEFQRTVSRLAEMQSQPYLETS